MASKTSKRTRFTSIILTLVMLMNLLPSAAFAEDEPATVADTSAIYVSSSGDDTNGDGSQENPYATISAAYTAAATGDTIYLLSDLTIDGKYSASAVNFNLDKNVTITSSGETKTIKSSCALTVKNALFYVTKGSVAFTDITLDGSGQTCTNATASENRYCAAVYVYSGTATIGGGVTIQNFNYGSACRGNWDGSAYGGQAVLYAHNSGATINILDGALIKNCKIEGGSPYNPAAVVLCGSGGTVYMTGGEVTGNSLQTDDTSADGPYNAIMCAGKINNPHLWMTNGKVTGNSIGTGGAAVYMRGEASQCDVQFGNTAYVYENTASDGNQRNVYLKNKATDGTENDNVYIKLCSKLTGEAKLGVYAEMIGIGTKVAQGSGINNVSYTATSEDLSYFTSDKETAASIVYCGGSEDTCGLLAHSTASPNHEKAIYLSVSPTVSASKGSTENTVDATISRCASDATYVVLDKDLKPVTDKALTGGEYNTDGNTFKLTDSTATTTIGMQGLPKDSGPYTVMLVGTDGLTVDATTGKASTDNLTDIATINIVNFAGDGVTWSDGTNSFENGDFDIVIVPHNDQTGKAKKSYTAAAKTNYTLATTNPITASGNLGEATITDATGGGKTASVEVPAYATTEKGTTNYNTVTLTGATVLNSGVTLLDKTDGDEMTDGKTYDGVAVSHTEGSVDGATLSYTWQKKNESGDGYVDITGNTAPTDAGDYNLKITATSSSDSFKVLGTQNLPFTINPKTLTVTATASDKTYDGDTTATLNSASLSGVLEADKSAVTLNNSKITVAFADKTAGDSKAVTATVLDGALSGDKAGNYKIESATAANAKISPKTLTATITATNKEYDGSANATVSTPTLNGVVSGDSVSATASDAKFVGGSGVDNNKTVTADITLSGDDAANYKLQKDTASATANITAKELKVTVTASNKPYDGTTNATVVATLDTTGIVTGDSVTLDTSNQKATFDTKEVGNDKAVTVTGLTLTGTGAANYKLPDEITGKANITQAQNGSGTVTLEGWTYGDEANTPVATSTTNPETTTSKITYQYKLKSAADTEYSNTVPTDAGEYTVKATFPANDNYAETTDTADFTISKKELKVNVTAANKVYDGTTTATLNEATLDGVETVDTDKVTLVTTGVTAAFDDKNAGTNIPVTLTGNYTLTGDAAKNYDLTQPTGLKANINTAPLTITGATVTPKTYDGNNEATITEVTFIGLKNNETLTANTDYTVYNAKYDNVNATGTDAATKANFNVVLNGTTTTKNYTLTSTAGTQTPATIGKANHADSALTTEGNRGETNTLSGVSAYVVTDGTVGTITTGGDDIFDETPTYDSDTGKLTYKLKSTATESQSATVTLPVTSTNYNDYKIVVTVGVTSKETLEIGIDNKNFEYNGTAQAPTGITVVGNKMLTSDLDVTYKSEDGTTYPESKTAPTNAGKYIMTVKVPEDNTKYTGSATCTFEITKKALTASITAENKIYDGGTIATVTPKLDGLVASDTGKVTATVTNPAFENKNADVDKTVTASITITGDAAKNYTVNETAETTANITPKEITISGLSAIKTYDGDNTADKSEITGTAVVGSKAVDTDDVSVNTDKMTGTFNSANVNEATTVTITGLTLTGDDAANYELPENVTCTGTITKAEGSGTLTLEGWTYGDEANTPVATSTTNPETTTSKITYQYKLKSAADTEYSNTVPTDAGEYTVKATFPANDNYAETTDTADFTISKKELKVNVTAANKVYDGTTTATLNEATLDGVETVDTDKVTLVTTGVTAAFDDKNAGTNIPVTLTGNYTLTGDAAKNYDLTQPTGLKANINTAPLTITGATVTPKTYDGNNEATITEVTFIGLKNNETLTANTDYTVYNAKYDNVNATGTDAATKANFNVVLNGTTTTKNYTLTSTAGTQTPATIGKANHADSALTTEGNRGETNTLSGVSAYVVTDGTVGTITTGGDDIFDETPTYDSDTGKLTYKLKSTATESQSATVTLPVTSTNYNDYKIVVTVGVTSKETLEIGIDNKNFEYNGTAQAPTGITVVGNKMLTSDLDVTYKSEDGTTYPESKTAPTNAGKYIMTVKVPEDNTKYTGSATCTFEITKKALTASITAENKIYDGGTIATVTPKLDGLVASDTGKVTAMVTNPAFENKNADVDKTVTASITITGDAAKNYTVNETAETTANITPKEITISGLTIETTKVYDGNTNAKITNNGTLNDVETDDVVTIKPGTATYDNKNVGENKTVTFSGFELEGTDASNYTLTQPSATTANIDKRELTITGASVTQKQYDGTDAATVTSVNFDGLQSGDVLTANTDYTISNAKYDGVNATGEGAATKVDFDVALTNTTLANNYKLKTEKGTQDSQTIKKADVTNKTTSTSGIRGQENTFDMPDGFMVEGANIASITVTKDDNSILAHEPKYADNKLTYELNSYAENGQSAVTQLKISSQNYDFYFIDITIGVDKKQEVAITIDDATLTYNATPQAPTGITVVGNEIPVSELEVTYEGADGTTYEKSETAPINAGKYTMTVKVPDDNNKYTGSATCSFEISPKELTVNVTAANKVYDGTTSATLNKATLDGVETADIDKVTLVTTGVTAAFDDKNAGTNIPVTLTGNYTLTGDAAKNYTANDTAEITANITPKEITISDVTIETTKVYDGNTNAKITNNGTLNDVETGDTVTIKPGTATYDNKNIGENKTVTFSDFELEGTDASNYTLTQPAATSAAITAKALTIDPVVIAEKYYDGTNKADYIATPKLVGVVDDEDVTLINGTPTFSTVSVGRDIPINFTDFALDGTDKGNYTLIQPTNITADISAYIPSRLEYTTTTKEWTNQDFVVTAKSGWQVSTTNTADGEWSDTLTCSNETGNTSDSLTFYVKNATYGFISEVITETYKIDKTTPVISGAEDGKTYCAAVTLTITDENLDTVTLNGDIVTIEDGNLTSANNNFDTAELSSETATMTDGKLTLGPAEGEQTVVATDKAGNSSSITVTVNGDHTWGAWTSDGDGAHHTRICQIDSDHIETAECHGGVATCKDKAVCEDCKSSYGELDPQNHVNLIRVEAKAATTDAEGNIEYWYCDGCDKYYEDADATKEITKADTVIAKLDSDSTVNTSPSTGNENTAKTLAKTGNDTTTKTFAKTGDENIMFIWMALLLASGAAVATTTLVCRKKKNNR